MPDIISALREKILILDGAMGTLLQARGMKAGECPELFGVNNFEALSDIHREYIEAGSDIIQSNTFGANRYKLAEYGLENRVTEINMELIKAAKKGSQNRAWVAACIGPTGKMLKPVGDVEFEDLYNVFAEQIIACERAGADLINIETMTDIGELRAAIIAAKSTTRLPVIAHLTFEQDNRTLMGTDPMTAAIILKALSPLAIGANCSGGAKELLPIIQEMAKYTSTYLSVEPNAGLPKLIGNETVFPDAAEEMAEYALRLRDVGANIIGGCCGSTPAHIEAIAKTLKGLAPLKRTDKKIFALASRTKNVLIGNDAKALNLIGERINPTARKKLAQDIKDGHMHIVVKEAKEQALHGASVLDVNMGVPGIDEALAMKQAVQAIQTGIDIPLAIDSTNPLAIEEGLKNFVGRAIINSTTGEDKNLEIVLPLAKKYGAAVLGLCLDESGIPDSAEDRFVIAKKIYQRAKEHGLRDEDIYIDCLVKTASAEQAQVMETIKAVRMVKKELGVGTVLGISNVSHGLPARDILNATYLAMALEAGLDLPILNPFDEKMMDVMRATAVLLNRDINSNNYIKNYKDYQNQEKKKSAHPICEQCNIPNLLDGKPIIKTENKDVKNFREENKPEDKKDEIISSLEKCVLEGDREQIKDLLDKALNKYNAVDVLNQALIPGIERAGDLFDKKEYFLPQLMMSAETMKKAFLILKPLLGEESGESKGTIIMATVEGDIHDIGKNIVCILLENYGFNVIDLGKDVSSTIILEQAEKLNADIIGLSALMTTTMPRMQEIIEGVKARGLKSKIMVGGAVLNQEYADLIGADAYSTDAREAVLTAQRLISLFIK